VSDPENYKPMKKTLLIFILLIPLQTSIFCSNNITVKTGEIKDMVLIYNGGAHRKVIWDESHFEPYVSYHDEKNKEDYWLFDGFLFLEILDGNGRGYASGYAKESARKEEWIGLIDQYLTKGNAIQALDNCIENAKNNCGRLTKRKIVISLPEPIPNQKDWGELNGKKLDFSNDEDRITACKWYIDFIIQRFNDANMRNVELQGFYWLAEEATNTRTFVHEIANYVHDKMLSMYWIPYFKSDGYNEWKSLGFDQAFLQPNHFFNDTIPDSRIDDACQIAKSYGMSMEMEFDERATEQGGKRNRMKAYIDGFNRNNIFEKTDVAYYQGNDAFYQLRYGTENDVELYNELASIIAKRQKKYINK